MADHAEDLTEHLDPDGDPNLEEEAELEGAEQSEEETEGEEAEQASAEEEEEGGGEEEPNPVGRAVVAERRKWQQRLEEANRRNQYIEERFNKMVEAQQRWLESQSQGQQRQQEAEPEIPDFTEDPEGHVRALQDRHQRQLQALEQKVSQGEEHITQQQQMQQLTSQIAAREQQFVADNPDYYDALSHVRQVESKRLEALGVPPEQIQQTLSQQELQMATFALRQGRNPAQAIYESAKYLGYQGKQEEGAQDEEAAKIEAKAKRDKAKSMGGGGKATSQSMEDLGEDEFDELMTNLFPGATQKYNPLD